MENKKLPGAEIKPENDRETMLAFQAQNYGYDAGAKAERARLVGVLEDICSDYCADGVTVGEYANGNEVLKQLKQRLGN